MSDTRPDPGCHTRHPVVGPMHPSVKVVLVFDNFDPLKSTNPFAYFTQIIYYAFLRRILKEKKQL